ncbi:MAG: T9SS type A sorting domain-containing protein [Saprospiraceae bacterium]|nr:T9SS type A sorting domain-containing protein [Saprospiraceae bacterium]
MNVFLRRKRFLLFFFLACSLSAWGQLDRVSLTTFENQAVKDTFTSYFPLQWATPTPQNGNATWRQIASTKYELTYTPINGFVGTDHFRISYFPVSFASYIRDYTIEVKAAQLIANHDYAFGAENTSLSINVLGNDISSNGVKNLTVIPLTNNGNATFQPGASTIEFTPEPDFEGVAYINYVVCNGAGLCDNGTVTIQVLGDNTNLSDTLRVFTKKNNAQVILVPNNFSVTSAPGNGAYDDSGDAPQYSPNQDFIGKDYIGLSNGSVNKVVEVIVIDAEKNMMAFDDEAYTSPETIVELNVLENDLYGYDSGCFTIKDQPQNGTVEASDGIVTYYPASGFEGVDWFTYSINAPGCGAEEEVATVYVYVSNFEPSQTKFFMYTPKHTPLVIGNDVPISNFMYKIKAQGQLGKAVILEGQRDTTINNQTIAGNNLILYLPNDNVNAGVDEFEITYCVYDDAGRCAYEKSIKVEIEILDINRNTQASSCIVDCIWPGDTNRDGVVNMEDLLPIGVGMGAVGVPRSDADFSEWYGQQGNDWTYEEGELNFKHVDTNGDSIVTALDTAAIRSFFGYTHDLTSAKIPFYKYTIELHGDVFYNPGDLVELDMVLGNEEYLVVDLYGFTFPFEYIPVIIKKESVQIDYAQSSWLTYNSPFLQMSHNNERGLIETGFTRTSGLAASGFGEIGKIRFVVRDDIAGIRPGDDPMVINIGSGTSVASNSAGQTYGMNIQGLQIYIIPQSEEEIENAPLTDDLLKVYPNPAQDLLNIHLNGGQEFEQVIVYNITGQVIYNSGKTLARKTQIDVSQMQNGIYVLSVVTPKGVVNKKFEVLR